MPIYNAPEIKEELKYYSQVVGQPLFNTALSFIRMNRWPLDPYSRFRNLEEAWHFIGDSNNPAYPGQIISTYNVDGVPNSAVPSSKKDGKYRLYTVTLDESKPNGLGLREFSGAEDAYRIINYIPNYANGSESSTRILNSDSSSGPLTFAPGNDNLSFTWHSEGLKNILRISSSDFKVETKKEANTKLWITGVRQALDSSITTNVFDPSIFITENPGEIVIPTINSSTANIDFIDATKADIDYIEAIDISVGGYSITEIAQMGPFFKLSLNNANYRPAIDNPHIIVAPESKDLDEEYVLKSLYFNEKTLQWETIPNSDVVCSKNVFAYDSKQIPEFLNSFSVQETAQLECVRTIDLNNDSSWYGDIIQSLWPIYEFMDSAKLEYSQLKCGIALFNTKGRCSEILVLKFIPKCTGMDQNNKYMYEIKTEIY